MGVLLCVLAFYYCISLGHTTVNTITLQHEHEHRRHSDKLREDRRKLTQTYKQNQNDGEGRQNTDAVKIIIKYCSLVFWTINWHHYQTCTWQLF